MRWTLCGGSSRVLRTLGPRRSRGLTRGPARPCAPGIPVPADGTALERGLVVEELGHAMCGLERPRPRRRPNRDTNRV